MNGFIHSTEILNKISIQPHSAKALYQQGKWLNEHVKHEQEKAIRSREVDDSIISISEQQKKTNIYLEQSHNLSGEQIKLTAILVEAQNALRHEQMKSSIEAKRAALIQFWMNVLILILTIIGVGYAIAQFHKV